MKLVKVSNLVPGMVLAKDLYQPSGSLLILDKGTILSAELLTKLRYWKVDEVPVEELPPSLIEEQEERLAPQMAAAHARMIDMTEEIMSAPEEKLSDMMLLRGMVAELEDQIDLNADILLNLSHLKEHDNYLFAHAVNVCIIALILGRELKLDHDVLKELGLAALLHDLGMIRIEREMYDRERQLTTDEWLLMRGHPESSCEILRENGSFSSKVYEGIIQHHERMDGSGYPRGLRAEQISIIGKIIAIADVYDAGISPRKYRRRMTSHNAIKYLISHSHLFDLKILKAMLSSMAIYPVGCFVRLNTGEIAKVTGINHGVPFRPEIRIFFDNSFLRVQPPVRLNLKDDEYTQTYIAETLEYDESERVFQILKDEALH